jgi:hypothetical protein
MGEVVSALIAVVCLLCISRLLDVTYQTLAEMDQVIREEEERENSERN